MGRVAFTENNKVQTDTNYSKLKLEKNEMARVVCLEDPVAKWYHRLTAPKIINGVPEKEWRETKKGEKYEDYVYDFIGNPLCLGDDGKLADTGADADNCPICAEARKGDLVQGPQRRYAMNIFKYSTRQGSTDVLQPFSGFVIAWSFTDKIFNKLVDYNKEWGNLQEHDLYLGPCTNPGFPQFEISISKDAVWRQTSESQQFTVAAFRDNKLNEEQLATLCGRASKRSWIEDDLQKIRDRWAIVNGSTASVGTGAPDLSAQVDQSQLAAGLDDLLTSQTGQAAPQQAASAPANSFDDLLGGGGQSASAAAPEATQPAPEASQPAAAVQTESAPAAPPAQSNGNVTADLLADVGSPAPEQPAQQKSEPNPKPGSSGESVSFDDLLGGLS